MRSSLTHFSLLLLLPLAWGLPPLQAAQATGVQQAKDWVSFELGTIFSFCEMVKAGAKKLALGPPLKPGQYERIREGHQQIVKRFGVKTFLEKEFLVTDLFPGEAANGEWVSLYYAGDDVLEKYLALKKQKQQLVKAGAYQGPARKELARSFGRLLSYPEWRIDELLGEPRAANGTPRIASQVTFLYFNELDKAAAFYAGKLGLRLTFDGGWVKIFELSPSSSVGLVDATHGAHRPSAEKPVMVSMVMSTPDDVDRWFAQLKAQGVQIARPPGNSDKVPVRAFEFKDPEGHSLEVFAWLLK
jgi:catechol 2,3-dioxygenase-like lactoylglutathione lyase family enzyme